MTKEQKRDPGWGGIEFASINWESTGIAMKWEKPGQSNVEWSNFNMDGCLLQTASLFLSPWQMCMYM